MGVVIFPNFDKMKPEEFYLESLKLFNIRMVIDRAIRLERASRVGISNCTTPERAEVIRKYYTMDLVLDISSFDTNKTFTIKIVPQIDENGHVSFERFMKKGDKIIRDKHMDFELESLKKMLLRHIAEMGRTYQYNLHYKQWPNLYRRY